LPRGSSAEASSGTPLVFLLAAIALTVNLWFDRPVRSTLGLPVILGGIPFFYFKRSSSNGVFFLPLLAPMSSFQNP